MVPRKYTSMLILSEYLALIIIAMIGVDDLIQAGKPLWLALILLIVFAGLLLFWPVRHGNVYFASQAVLIATLSFLSPDFVFLGLGFSAEVAIFFPNRIGIFWIAAVALTNAVSLINHLGWSSGGIQALFLTSGYAAFGLFSYARAKAEQAQEHSETLLRDLSAAHRRLQDYADRVEQLAVAEERVRLAREMHDTLGHRLTVAAVQLEGAQRLILDDPQRAGNMVATVREQVVEALRELREVVSTLRISGREFKPLDEALKELCDEFSRATEIPVELCLPEELPELLQTQRLTLYRGAQEALTNIQRHAGAGQAIIRLESADDGILLEVQDDGCGLPQQALEKGYGLRGLRERVASLNGDFWVGAGDKGGTVLRISLPEIRGDENE